MPATGAQFELQFGSAWTDITDRVYLRDRVRITRGRQDEGAQVDPSTCTLTLNNKQGYFSPRNALSPLYGLIGRGTPLRLSVPGPDVYLDMDGSAARATTPRVSALDFAGDIDVRAEVTANWRDLNLRQTIVGRWGTTAPDQLWIMWIRAGFIRFSWNDSTGAGWNISVPPPDEMPERAAIRATLDVNNGAGGATGTLYWSDSISGTWTVLGSAVFPAVQTLATSGTAALTVAPSDPANTLVPMVGRVHHVEVRSGIGGTVVAAPDFTAQAPGATGFTDSAGRVWTVAAGALSNRSPRFLGEVSAWPAKWDVSGGDVYVQVQAAGILRRLGQGASPLDSTLKRRVPSDPNVVAYWPMEESGGTQAYSPVQGVSPMRVTGMQWAGDDSLPGSLALPVVQAPCSISASVPGWASPTQWRTELVYRLNTVPSSTGTLINFTSSGTVKKWTIRYGNGAAEVVGVDGDGNTVVDSNIGPIDNTTLYGQWVRQQFTLSQSGGTVTWSIGWVPIGQSSGSAGVVTGTYSGTTGTCTGVNSVFSTQTVGAAIGHIAAFKTAASSIYDSADTGFDGETAWARINRLCAEEGAPVSAPYGAEGVPAMGPQTASTFLDLLDTAADADVGILYEARDRIALAYRTRTSLYNQPVALALDYSARGEVAPDLTPTEDDLNTVNDVTVGRPNGSSARATLDTGALSTQPPPAGIGRYSTTETVNVHSDDQLPDIAGWLLHLGAWDEARYPQVTVNLAAGPWLVNQATAVEIGDRIQIANPPAWLPPESIDLIAQGYTETIGAYDWTITYNCTPAGPWTVGIIEDSSRPARFDTDGCQLAADVTAGAGTLLLATTTGRQWVNSIQYPAEFPFDLELGGERVTVNSLGGVVADNFERTTSSGWGVTNTGDTWTTSGGSASDFSVSGGLGRMSLGSVNVSRWARVPSAYADVDLSVFLSTSALAAGGSQYVALAARAADTNNAYLARLAANTDQTMTLAVIKRVSSVETVLGTYVVPGLAHVAGSYYGLRFQVVGSTLRARSWPFAYDEPSGWPITVTDTDLTAPGTVGIRCLLSSSNTNTLPVTVTFDGFQQQTPQMAFVTRAVNGISKAQTAGTAVALADPTYIAL